MKLTFNNADVVSIIEDYLEANTKFVAEDVRVVTTWNGIEIKHDAAISRNALVVNENNAYQSGNYLKKIKIEYTTKPLSYQTGALADFYIDDALLENNENGLEISNNSYIKASTLQNFATSTQTGQSGA